jgi:hypothetical protein
MNTGQWDIVRQLSLSVGGIDCRVLVLRRAAVNA